MLSAREVVSSGRPELALEYLLAQPASTIKLGLERVQAALAALGSPQLRVPSLHVAGTNGKGSTCAVAASCLAQRYRTGLYTSPHLERVNERIQVQGSPIDDEVLGRRVLEVLGQLGNEPGLTFFELGTVVALWHFAQERVDVAVLETGLGGRLDATRAGHAVVTAITAIGLDHQEYLGDTLPLIAREKAGIIRPGVPVIVSAQPDGVLPVIAERAAELGAPLSTEGQDFSLDADGTYRSQAGGVLPLSYTLRGPHQRHNVATAVACVEALGAAGFPLDEAALRRGVALARWPGRLELFSGPPDVLLDGAHNPAGVDALLTALSAEFPGRPVHLVFGVFADKAYEVMVARLFSACASVVVTPLPSPRGLAPEVIVQTARNCCPAVPVAPAGGVVEALEAAQQAASVDGGLVLVAGSLLLVGLARGRLAAVR